MLVWSDADVAACLEVLPTYDEDGDCYSYVVASDGLRLELAVSSFAADVALALYRDGVEAAVFSVRLVGCEAIRHVTDGSGEFLEFAPAECFSGRYDDSVTIPFGFRLAVKPSIRISLFSKASM